MMTHEAQSPRTFERLLESIDSARAIAELDRLAGVAQQHYSGVMLEDLEVEIAVMKTKLPPNHPALG